MIKTISKKLFLIVAALILEMPGAQSQVSPLIFDTSGSSIVEFNYRLNFESNSLHNTFATKLQQGSFIERQELEDIYDALPSSNSAGYLQQFRARLYLPHQGIAGHFESYFVGIHHMNLIEAEFNRDLFGMVFLGNKRFAGEEVTLSNENFRQISYQSLNAGYMKRWVCDSSKLAIGVSASFLKGQNLLDVNIHKAKAFTSILGDEIDLTMDYQFTRSDTQYTAYFDMNGYGAGIGFFVLYEDKSGIRLSVEINDLGAIRWVNNRYNYHKDSSMVFRGWEIENIFELDGKVFEDATLDSLYSIGKSETKSQTRWVPSPSLLQFDVSVPLCAAWLRMGIHAEHLLFTQRLPLLSAGPEFILFQGKWRMMPFLTTGGYNSNSIGFRTDILLSNQWAFGLGSNSLDGLIQPETRSGQSIYFVASHKFNSRPIQ